MPLEEFGGREWSLVIRNWKHTLEDLGRAVGFQLQSLGPRFKLMVFSADSRFQGLGQLALRFRVPEVEFRVSGVQMGLRENSCTLHFLRSPRSLSNCDKGLSQIKPKP